MCRDQVQVAPAQAALGEPLGRGAPVVPEKASPDVRAVRCDRVPGLVTQAEHVRDLVGVVDGIGVRPPRGPCHLPVAADEVDVETVGVRITLDALHGHVQEVPVRQPVAGGVEHRLDTAEDLLPDALRQPAGTADADLDGQIGDQLATCLEAPYVELRPHHELGRLPRPLRVGRRRQRIDPGVRACLRHRTGTRRLPGGRTEGPAPGCRGPGWPGSLRTLRRSEAVRGRCAGRLLSFRGPHARRRRCGCGRRGRGSVRPVGGRGGGGKGRGRGGHGGGRARHTRGRRGGNRRRRWYGQGGGRGVRRHGRCARRRHASACGLGVGGPGTGGPGVGGPGIGGSGMVGQLPPRLIGRAGPVHAGRSSRGRGRSVR